MLDAKKISMAIRSKKKKMMDADPELVETDTRPDLDPVSMMDNEMDARISHTLGTPDPIDATETNMDMSNEESMNIGENEDEKKRMGRLKRLIDAMDL